jgi:hypothetical protein
MGKSLNAGVDLRWQYHTQNILDTAGQKSLLRAAAAVSVML